MGNGAETGLVGIHIMDPGTKVIAMFGNPDEILNLGQLPSSTPGPAGGSGFGGNNFNGPPGGPGFGPGNRGGFPPGVPGGPNRPPGKQGPAAGGKWTTDPGWDFQNDTLLKTQLTGTLGPGAQGGGQPGFRGGPPPGFQGPPGQNQNQFDSGQVGSEPAPTPYYVRWVYKKGPSQYSFIVDKEDRVVQIEAVGMGDPRVRTNKGLTFGGTFADLMKRYGTPDGYEITGDSLVLRYLSKNHVAFRLNRLETDKPHEITAIVVAGGKR